MAKVTVDRELFDTLIEYAIELRSEWYWRYRGSERLKIAYEDLSECINKAVKIRDNITGD